MTLYYEKLKSLALTQQPDDKNRFNRMLFSGQQGITVSLIITNMKSQEDCTRLVEGLRTLPGIINVTPFLLQRRLTITYSVPQTNLELIGHHIRKLGYLYIQKA